ncbi:MAG: acyl-CoA dehydrogenase family protein, partial [Alphaproteobacteria bacterium]
VFASAERYQEMLGWYSLGCAATCQGASYAAWEILKDWGETRVIKGKGQIFKENPLTAALLGEIGGRIGTGRLLVYQLARLLAQPDGNWAAVCATATAGARQVIDGAMFALDRGMELMASAGYATEWNLERYWRDVKTVGAYLAPLTAAQIDLARHYFEVQSL